MGSIGFSKMALIGCGLIGGSLAIALRQAGQVNHIVGVDMDDEHLRTAKELGVIDEIAGSMEQAVAKADLVILATPVRETVRLIGELTHLPLESGCIVSDVSGTKQEVNAAARDLPHNIYFIGGHPMAGSEKAGIRAANGRLFENAVYVLSPDPRVPADVIKRFQQSIEAIRARVLLLDVKAHDQVVGAISHLPHLIAAQLVVQVADLSTSTDLYKLLAAGGFRDVTRIAAANPVLWRDVVLSNREVLLELMEDWIRRNQHLVEIIRRGDEQAIEDFFAESREWREALPVRGKGAIHPLYQFTVSVADEPGSIAHIAALLAKAAISIRNIGILESREGDNGQLLLTFDRETEMDSAVTVLSDNGYNVFKRD